MFSRVTLVAATEVLGLHSQATFDQMVIRLELESEISADTRTSIQKKCALLARIVAQRPNNVVETLEGPVPLGDAVVREAVAVARRDYSWEPQDRFLQALAKDGYSLSWGSDGRTELRPALPIQLGSHTDDEVHQLLREYGFATACGHLDQALDAHIRGNWAATNAQLRTFMESLLDDIATTLRPSEATTLTSENRRALLGKVGFFSKERNEWTGDGKNYVNGLFKMLHTEGSHTGLSDVEHCTFRLHVVLVTARTFLRRLESWKQV